MNETPPRLSPSLHEARIIAVARRAIEVETEGLVSLRERVDDKLVEAVHVILQCRGRVVVMGMGKSGHVGRKIAATLASTGTPAMFVHPGEASHGDLGMITRDDVVMALSNSGESDELKVILPVLRRLGTPVVAMTGRLSSTLGRHANVALDSSVKVEACPLNLAPTASTTVQLALGDALAVCLLDARGFREEDFARSHPGGSLGRKLLTHVRDVMRTGDGVPKVKPNATLIKMMREMSAKGLGATAVVDDRERPIGIFTDGDLRRLIEGGADLQTVVAAAVMHTNPQVVHEAALAADAAQLMERSHITSVLAVDDTGVLVGALNAHDLMHARVM